MFLSESTEIISEGEVKNMNDYLERLKEEMELFSEEQATITVSRKDLDRLVKEVERWRELKGDS